MKYKSEFFARLIGSRALLNLAAVIKDRKYRKVFSVRMVVLPLPAILLFALLLAGSLYSVYAGQMPALLGYFVAGSGLALGTYCIPSSGKLTNLSAVQASEQIASSNGQEKLFNVQLADSLITSLPGIFLLLDADGNIARWNDNFAGMLNKTPAQLANMPILSLLKTEEKRLFAAEKLREVLEQGSTYAELEIESDLGFTVHFNFSASRVQYGGATVIVVIGTDITARKQLEFKLAEAEYQNTKLLHCLSHIPAAVVITNCKGVITYVNKKFTEITGYSKEEAIGKSPALLRSGFHDTRFYSGLWACIKSGEEWRGEFYNRRKDGSLYWESAVISPLLGTNGKPQFYVAVKEDITENRRKETELAEARKKAAETEKLRSYFFANMSHELRTPFVGIRSYAEILHETVVDAEARELASKIISSSTRLTETLTNILTLARLEFEPPTVNPVPVDIERLLLKVSANFRKKAVAKQLLFSANVIGHLPILICDEPKLTTILNNLLDNAIKYTLQGSITITAGQEYCKDGAFLFITVTDTGIGIAPEHQEEVWAPFRQESEGYSRSFEGSGLGLTVIRKYVELLGGEITMRSQRNTGTEFKLRLPVTDRNSLG